MIAPYRRVLSLPGTAAFSAAGLVARLPLSMVGLGLVLLVSDLTGSYGQAGRISATYILANAVTAVFLARLVDRMGQRQVILVASPTAATMLAATMTALYLDWPGWMAYVGAAATGAFFPNLGSAVRTRWTHALRDQGEDKRSMLDTAFALEAVNDEMVFIVGPSLVTLLAAGVHPLAGLTVAIVAWVAGSLWFCSQRRTEPPVDPHAHRRLADKGLPWRRLAPVAGVAVLMGALFGSCEVATVALAEEQGRKAVSGLLLAVWSLGSLVSGVVTGAMALRRGADARLRLGLAALALSMLPLPFVTALLPLGGVLLVAGLAISPSLIAVVSYIESVVPNARLNEGMAVFSTSLVVGLAPGAAVTGAVVDAEGASMAYVVAVGSAVVAAALAQLVRTPPSAPALGGPGRAAGESLRVAGGG